MVIPLQLRCDTSSRLRETGTPYAVKATPAARLPTIARTSHYARKTSPSLATDLPNLVSIFVLGQVGVFAVNISLGSRHSMRTCLREPQLLSTATHTLPQITAVWGSVGHLACS